MKKPDYILFADGTKTTFVQCKNFVNNINRTAGNRIIDIQNIRTLRVNIPWLKKIPSLYHTKTGDLYEGHISMQKMNEIYNSILQHSPKKRKTRKIYPEYPGQHSIKPNIQPQSDHSDQVYFNTNQNKVQSGIIQTSQQPNQNKSQLEPAQTNTIGVTISDDLFKIS
jgi:hypothetical protein